MNNNSGTNCCFWSCTGSNMSTRNVLSETHPEEPWWSDDYLCHSFIMQIDWGHTFSLTCSEIEFTRRRSTGMLGTLQDKNVLELRAALQLRGYKLWLTNASSVQHSSTTHEPSFMYYWHKPLKHRVDHNRFNKPLQSRGPTATPVHSPTSSALSFLGGLALN